MTTYHKSEHCWCGDAITVSSADEASVIARCDEFREQHRHRVEPDDYQPRRAWVAHQLARIRALWT